MPSPKFVGVELEPYAKADTHVSCNMSKKQMRVLALWQLASAAAARDNVVCLTAVNVMTAKLV